MVDERKAALYEEFARVGKALASPLRLLIVDVLAQGERSVEDLATAVGAKLANTSAQLQVLRNAGLVVTRRDGNRIWYRLSDDDVADLLDRIRDTASRHLADTERAAAAYLGDPAGVEHVTPDELARRIAAADVTVIDVRPDIEYRAGHLPGAISIPFDDLERRLAELPADTDIVAYCRGPYCVLAPQAARFLNRHGHIARVLTTGLPQWRRSGRPVHHDSPSTRPAGKAGRPLLER
ncbi:MAG TPA: metalloregulator ArsR/SmtB family transcription factor [Acidimicrobiales bacterium]|nr:metalloregulator ArsR/SmtB family transcription factor [Acidimicrobiales bacterium]